MRGRNRLNKFVTIWCQNHPESTYNAAVPDDFKKAPEGGCKLSCKYLLPCGHICQKFCHVLDKTHEFYRCLQKCARINPCGHKCQKHCYQKCDPCNAITDKVIPACGHKANMKCYKNPNSYICQETCSARLTCGHNCNLKCGDCSINGRYRQRCEARVEKQWSCGHIAIGKRFHDPRTIPCPSPCNVRLNCGHTCSGTCGGCLEGKVHRSFMDSCKKTLPSGQKYQFHYSENCPHCARKFDDLYQVFRML